MRFLAFTVLSVASIGCLATSPPPLLANGDPLPISLREARLLFQQCSRTAPVPEGALWLPSFEEVLHLQRLLPGYLNGVHEKGGRIPPVGPQYLGQYVGFRKGGVRYIYASFVPESLAPEARRKGRAVRICDGGSSIWGVVYDPRAQKFSYLEFNGQ